MFMGIHMGLGAMYGGGGGSPHYFWQPTTTDDSVSIRIYMTSGTYNMEITDGSGGSVPVTLGSNSDSTVDISGLASPRYLTFPEFEDPTLVRYLYALDNNLHGSIPSLIGFTGLQIFRLDGNNLSGEIPNLSGLSSIQSFYCYNNQLTGWGGGSIPVGLTNFRAQGNVLSQVAIDNLLSAFDAAGASDGTLNLGGTNAAPSAAGLTKKASLEGKGWTVTVST